MESCRWRRYWPQSEPGFARDYCRPYEPELESPSLPDLLSPIVCSYRGTLDNAPDPDVSSTNEVCLRGVTCHGVAR